MRMVPFSRGGLSVGIGDPAVIWLVLTSSSREEPEGQIHWMCRHPYR